ncbi:hypothetical protein KM043_009870 [Ampulex compressa]|nr:hypothetical protein KM043_009870 [Ampulex compressa]
MTFGHSDGFGGSDGEALRVHNIGGSIALASAKVVETSDKSRLLAGDYAGLRSDWLAWPGARSKIYISQRRHQRPPRHFVEGWLGGGGGRGVSRPTQGVKKASAQRRAGRGGRRA